MVLSICTKFHEYILNSFGDVKHESTSLMVLKTDPVDTVFKLKTLKGIILLKFRSRYDSCSLQIFRSCFKFVPSFMKIS